MRRRPLDVLLCLFAISGAVWHVSATDRYATHAARKFHGPNGLLRSIPAFTKRSHNPSRESTKKATEVGAVRLKRPKLPKDMSELPPMTDIDYSQLGLYYGLRPDKVSGYTKKAESKLSEKDAMFLTLDEVRGMRKEMEALRKEIRAMKRQMAGEDEEDDEDEREEHHHGQRLMMSPHQRQRHFDKIGSEVQRWAEALMEENEEDGWQSIECNKMFRGNLNREGQTTAYLKWMKDSRGEEATKKDNREYPCIRVHTTIDAPMEEVCLYLSQEQRAREYNDLVIKHKDLEELTSHSKICWGETPQILFIKPRQLITFCHHRWLRDGTAVVVNQACDHLESSKLTCPRAYALRGANFIAQDPEDPSKTRITMFAHASAGADVPTWAVKTAVSALAPIEPFKLFHRINEGVKKALPELQLQLENAEMVSTPGQSNRPVGIAQMGYACFWPNGGGQKEGSGSNSLDAP